MKQEKKKKVAVTILLLSLIMLAIASLALFLGNADDAQTDVSTQVEVKDGVVTTPPIVNNFELKGKANMIHVEWGMDELPGFVSAIVVTDPDGKEVFVCTGDGVSADSVDLDLKKGTYQIEVSYYASQEALSDFADAHKLEVLGDPFEGFGQDGSWKMNYSVSMSMGRNYYRTIGILVGVLIGILIAILILRLTKTNDSMKCEYDERQEAARGKGFKYGFFTAIVYNCIAALCMETGVELPMDASTTMIVGIVVAAAVMVTYQIMNDCYFSMNEDRKKVMAFLGFAAVINLVSAINNYRLGELFKDGKLCFASINIICFAVCAYAICVILIKMALDKREED